MPALVMNHQTQLPLAALASSLVDLYVTSPEKKPLTEFRIFRRDVNPSDKGDFLFDEQAAASVMAAYERKAIDVSIDYDHQALRTPEVKAPAAGWFSLEVRDGELWATNVRWTPTAQEHLEKGEYRYFSPLFTFDERTARIKSVINCALTNTPALHAIDALVAASRTLHLEDPMDEKLKEALARVAELERQAAAQKQEIESLRGQSSAVALSSTVGLTPSASSAEVQTRVAALVSFRKDVFQIAGKDSEAATIGVLTAMKEQAAEVATLREKAETSELAALSAEFGAELDRLSTKGQDGKFLSPAKRKSVEEKAMKGGTKLTKPGIEEARGYLSLVLEPGAPAENQAKEPNAMTALSALEMEIASKTGTSLKDKQAYKERMAARSGR